MIPEDESTYFKWPRISPAAEQRVLALMEAGHVSWHPETFEAFEADVARLFGVRHALCCNNGTAACFSALKALGIASGDSVIASSITHWGSVLPAVQCGAQVALADVLPDTSHADPASVRALIDGTTRAVVVTHMWGEPIALDEMRAVCNEHNIALIEDTSHAHGATFCGRPVGSFGDVSFCSFQGKKVVAGGEGGALLTDRPELYYRAMELGNAGRLFSAPVEWQTLAGVGHGFKFRPSPLLVAIAHESLKELDTQIALRRRAYEQLRGELASSKYFAALDRDPCGRIYFQCELLVANGLAPGFRDRLVDALRAEGIRAQRTLYPFLPDHPSLHSRLKPNGCWPVARSIMQRLFYLEPFTAYSADLVERYTQLIAETAERVARGKC